MTLADLLALLANPEASSDVVEAFTAAADAAYPDPRDRALALATFDTLLAALWSRHARTLAQALEGSR